MVEESEKIECSVVPFDERLHMVESVEELKFVLRVYMSSFELSTIEEYFDIKVKKIDKGVVKLLHGDKIIHIDAKSRLFIVYDLNCRVDWREVKPERYPGCIRDFIELCYANGVYLEASEDLARRQVREIRAMIFSRQKKLKGGSGSR